jgi:hypothetical protein
VRRATRRSSARTGEEFYRVLVVGEKTDLDVPLAARDILEAGDQPAATTADIGAIVLECTNMPPSPQLLQRRLGVPVFDIYITR